MKITLFLIALFCSLSLFSQTRIGADIDGEVQGDESGQSVSLSLDGTVVAIGSPWNSGNGNGSGHVRVYKNNSGVWTQIGDDIDGEAESDYSGTSVSLSSDGSTVAIGAPNNIGNGDGYSTGHVRVFKNISGVWTQVGADIDGEVPNAASGKAGDKFGFSVSLSSDGTTVAIGAPYNAGNGIYLGHVRIYKNISGVWTQIGTDIDGEAGEDLSGWSVSLSSDGSTVAIGALHNSGNFAYSGHVRVYKNNSGVWNQIGADIDGEAAHDAFGTSVSLSSDGTVVAVGAPHNSETGYNAGHVRVFKNNSGVWTQIGADIDGEAANDESGSRVSLSADGNVLAIGATFNNGTGNGNFYYSGHVRIYKNISGVWTQIGTDIDGESAKDHFGRGLSLSSDGRSVAIGAPFNADYTGHVRVYDLSALFLGISDKHITEDFTVYPNPVNNQLQLQLATSLKYKQASIYNNLGQFVLKSKSTTINVSNLSPGVYFLELETNNGKGVKKILKE